MWPTLLSENVICVACTRWNKGKAARQKEWGGREEDKAEKSPSGELTETVVDRGGGGGDGGDGGSGGARRTQAPYGSCTTPGYEPSRRPSLKACRPTRGIRRGSIPCQIHRVPPSATCVGKLINAAMHRGGGGVNNRANAHAQCFLTC